MERFSVLRYAWKELSRRRIRTLIGVFGYAVAVAAVVTVASVAKPRIQNQANLLLTVGTHLVGFIPDPAYPRDKAFGPCAQGVYTAMMRAETLRRIQEIRGVKAAAPYILFQKQSLRDNTTVTLGGLDLGNVATEINACPPGDVIQGRYLGPGDTNAVLLEESYAAAARRGVGDTIEAFGRTFQVAGIVNTNIRAARASLYAPISVVREILVESRCVTAEVGDFNVALVEVADARRMEDVRRSLANLLANASIVSFNCYAPARDAVAATNTAAWVVAAVIALFVTLFAARTQWASVVERKRDIGILKAVGWPSGWVTRQILAESVLQSLAGGVLGCLISFLVILLVPSSGGPAVPAAGSEPIVLGWAVLAGIALALIGGVLAGLLPALRAYKLTPSDALRRL